MNILDQIIAQKHKEVTQHRELRSISQLEQSSDFSAPCVSMKEYLLRKNLSGIIAEIKRKSPSKGIINDHVSVEKISVGYVEAGASALSILTDQTFFGGSNDDLVTARKFNKCPILRKDFVLEEYQIIEAKSIGADAILLIAAVLDARTLKGLCSFAHRLGLEVLVEVHNEVELKDNLDSGADMMGINNRDLKTFEISVEISKKLSGLIPASILKVSESGIESPEAIVDLKGYGFNGFLMGQTFMQADQPEKAAMDFITKLRALESKVG